MLASRFPRLSRTRGALAAVLEGRGRRPVTFRTLDIGGDKVLPYMNGARGGKSGARLACDPHRARSPPRFYAGILRAMTARPPGRDLRVMLPMVSTVAEFVSGRDLLDRELAFARHCGRQTPRSIQLGVMVEVPSLLWQLDEIATHADFLSVGSQRSPAISVPRPIATTSGCPSASILCRSSFLRALKSIADVGALLGHAGRALRRDRRPPSRGDGADCARLSAFVDVGDGDRPAQGDGSIFECRGGP